MKSNRITDFSTEASGFFTLVCCMPVHLIFLSLGTHFFCILCQSRIALIISIYLFQYFLKFYISDVMQTVILESIGIPPRGNLISPNESSMKVGVSEERCFQQSRRGSKIKGYRRTDFVLQEKIRFGQQVELEDLESCTILLPNSEGTLVVRNCVDCLIIATCCQLRIGSSRHCVFCVYSYTSPVMEHCEGITFYPFPALEITKGISLIDMQISGDCATEGSVHLRHPTENGLRKGGETKYTEAKSFT